MKLRKLRRLLLLFVLIAPCLAGCTIPASHPALEKATLPALLPVRDFVASVNYNGGYQVSPDGRKLAWIAVKRFGPAIFVKTIGRDDTVALSLFSFDFRWAQDSRRLLLRKDQAGNENFHVWLADTEHPAKPAVDLTPFENIQARIHRVIQSDPNHVLVEHNRRDKRHFDLYRINLDTQEPSLMAGNPGDVASWVTSNEGLLRGRIRYAQERKWLELSQPGQEGWKTAYTWSIHDTVEVLGFSSDQEVLWLLSNRGHDLVNLTSFDLKTDKEQIIYEGSKVDVSQVRISRLTGNPGVAYSYPDYPHTHVFDARQRDELAQFQTRVNGADKAPQGIEIPSADDSEQRIVISLYSHAGKRYYLFDRRTGQETLLGTDAIYRHAADLAPIRPITLPSRDGLSINGYLTLPQGAGAKKLPMVLLVHGGPWARNLWADPDFWEDATRVQFLANRGYAVLQLNYRGSTGYGRKFTEAAVGEFAGKMQDDLLDGVQWAIDRGIADPDKIAIMGASYGGYAALVGLTFTPGVFACAIDIFGPSDLAAMMEIFPEYWQAELPFWHKYVGNPKVPDEREKMLKKSPLYFAAAAQNPVLIIQGANDVRVMREQSENMVAALRKAGKPVDYVSIAGMGHGTGHWPSKLKIYRKTEDFLAGCLGGRSSGFDFYQLGAWAF